jgi:ABC-type dipeptide/oligopeptide/nickel transport system permease component
MDWFELKQWLSLSTGLGMDALHVHAGVLVQILAALLLRRRLSSPIPWLIVLVLVLLNEWYDYDYEIWPDRGMQRAEGFRDAWNTLLLPTLILLLARFAPRLFGERDSAADAGEPGG